MNIDIIISAARTYAAHVGLKLTSVGNYAVNDGKFFSRIDAQGSCTYRTGQKLISYLDANWPADLEWPRDIPRPSKSKEAA